MLYYLTLPAMAAAAFQLPPLNRPSALLFPRAAPQDFCFPPFSTVTLRAPYEFDDGNGSPIALNTSVFVFEQLWFGDGQVKLQIQWSGAPFEGGPVPPNTPGIPGPLVVNMLQDTVAGASWTWFNYLGQNYCEKNTGRFDDAVCIGGGLSLNSTRTVGGRPMYSYVGYDPRNQQDGACWYSVSTTADDASDPAGWSEQTAQCINTVGLAQTLRVLAFSDYSTEPFNPNTFVLPPYCKK